MIFKLNMKVIFNIIKIILIIKIVNLINQNKEKSVSSPQNELNLDNMHILQVKGIKEFTDKIDSEILKTRICMGFLEKKRKKLSTYQKRWFVLISERPLVN